MSFSLGPFEFLQALVTPLLPSMLLLSFATVDEEQPKKKKTSKRVQSRVRQAKAHVISVLGEYAWCCQSKQINLEAKVGFNSSIEAGLVHESNSISADYLVLPGLRSRSNRTWHEVIKYCFEHAAEGCSVISIGKSQQPNLNSVLHKEVHQSRSEWLRKANDDSSSLGSPASEDHDKENLSRRQKDSPRTVLEDESSSSSSHSSNEDEVSSISGSTATTGTEDFPSKLIHSSKSRRQIMSPYTAISSFLTSSFGRRRTQSFSGKPKLVLQHQHQQPLLKCFTYEEIAQATNDFHPGNLVGVGGYSEVYRGDLPDGTTIAVKRLAKDNTDARKEKEFLTELGIIGHICHPNTATLVGCCIENGFYLILSFSQNGNLASALHGNNITLLLIAQERVSTSYVFLQITDFGLAKWLPNKWTHHAVIPIEGTFGYLAPEYFMHGIVDEKTDVYSFGVLLLEIISGRRPVDSSMQNLLLWAKPLMESGNVAELADPKLEGKYEADQMYRVVLTASYCVRQSAAWRPSMSEVLELLTTGQQDSEVAKSWRIPKFTSDELDDFSMVYGYDVPLEIDLEKYL
ncbi:unnamed protein product [Linum tenue]|uniref:Protein kinase domain-containing protein n=1 Tax=Linum tenue TaxID=586396 RepID=A0AAV0IZI8_9ROSI|nr:unnamed protein product [Linum tenue]